MRQSAESVTDLTDRYRYDIFFRTVANVVVLQVGFVAIIVLIFIGVIHNFEERFTATMVDGLADIISEEGSVTGEQVLRERAETKIEDLIIVFVIMAGIAAAFGYVLSLITLTPTRDALRSQKQFIGNIAHELRTPLSVIKTNVEVALMDPALDPKLRKMFASNIEELNRASDIINNLLSLNNFVRTEQIEFTNVDLGEIVDRAVGKLVPLAGSKSIEMSVRKSEYRTVWGNSTALEQVVMNLVKNALNYTQNGGHVIISVEPDYHGSIRLSVKDSGVGIGQKDLFRIFEPFYRADSSRARGKGSSGLGLTIVSEIVKLHRGSVTVKSALQKGTTVIVILPCGKGGSKEERDLAQQNFGEVSVDFSRRQSSAQ